LVENRRETSRLFDQIRSSIEGQPTFSSAHVCVMVPEKGLEVMGPALANVPTFLTLDVDKVTPEMGWLAVQMLSLLPNPKDEAEMDAFMKLLREYEFFKGPGDPSNIIVRKENYWGFGAGVQALVARIYADYVNVKALAIMA